MSLSQDDRAFDEARKCDIRHATIALELLFARAPAAGGEVYVPPEADQPNDKLYSN